MLCKCHQDLADAIDKSFQLSIPVSNKFLDLLESVVSRILQLHCFQHQGSVPPTPIFYSAPDPLKRSRTEPSQASEHYLIGLGVPPDHPGVAKVLRLCERTTNPLKLMVSEGRNMCEYVGIL